MIPSFLILHGFTWFYMVLHGFAWFYMTLHGFTWFYMVSHGLLGSEYGVDDFRSNIKAVASLPVISTSRHP
jgi:hypothetical protein